MLHLTPKAFLDQLALLIPPPRKHRHRYHGVLAPNAPLRQAVTARAGLPMGEEAISTDQVPDVDVDRSDAGSKSPPSTVYLWAILLARIYEVLPLICPQCGSELKIVAFVTEPDPILRILAHIGEPTTPPRIAPARAPPGSRECGS